MVRKIDYEILEKIIADKMNEYEWWELTHVENAQRIVERLREKENKFLKIPGYHDVDEFYRE